MHSTRGLQDVVCGRNQGSGGCSSLLSVTAIQQPDQMQLGGRKFIWLTIPGYHPSLRVSELRQELSSHVTCDIPRQAQKETEAT